MPDRLTVAQPTDGLAIDLDIGDYVQLRVIRQELASPSGGKDRKRTRPFGLGREDDLDLSEVCRRAGISGELARELEDYGLIEPRSEDGEMLKGDNFVGVTPVMWSGFDLHPRNIWDRSPMYP